MASTSSDIDDFLPVAGESEPHAEFPRAPLGWLLFGLVPGYLLAQFGPPIPPLALFGAGFGLLAASLLLRSMPGWIALFLPGTILLAWSWASVRQPTFPAEWDTLPPREVVAESRVVEMFSGSAYPKRQYALVEFEKMDAVVSELEGQRAFCSLLQDENHPRLEPGASYLIRGALYRINPDSEDDFARFLESSGAFFRLRNAWAVEELRPPPFWVRPLAGLKNDWSAWLTRAPEAREPQARLLGAMLLGERELLSMEQRQMFLLSGTMHLFAISGLHVMIVALTLQLILQFLPLPRRIGFAFVLCLLFLYVGVTGFSPSAMRAFSMMAFYWLAGILGRSPQPLPAVLASAVIVLLSHPSQLFSVGFQLSYSVVLSILLLGLPLAKELIHRWPLFVFTLAEDRTRWQRFISIARQRVIESLCISFSATIGSAPLIVLHFGVWTPGAILLNAVLMPMASLVVAIGVLIVLWGSVGLGLVGMFFSNGAWLVLIAMEWIVNLAGPLPGAYSERQWVSSSLAHGALLLYLCSLFLIHEPGLAKRLRTIVRFGLPAILVLGSLWLFSAPY